MNLDCAFSNAGIDLSIKFLHEWTAEFRKSVIPADAIARAIAFAI